MTDQELQKKRFVAAAIDIAIAIAISVVFGIGGSVLGFVVGRASDNAAVVMMASAFVTLVGAVVSLGYILARDVLASGRSIGKQTQGIRAVTTTGQPLTFVDSAKRNAVFAVGSALGVISALIGLIPCLGAVVNCLLWPLWVLGAVIGLAAVIVELVKISQDPEGVRLGDEFAGTRVTY